MSNIFESIINKYRMDSLSEREKGDKFEKLIAGWLKTTPEYKSLFSDVWQWNEFPFREQFGGKDTGIDIVCKTITDEYYAVQCKCYKAETRIDKPAVDTFLSTSSKVFDTESGKKSFTFRIWIDTTKNGFNAEAENSIQNQNPPVRRIGLIELQNDNVDWEKLDSGIFGAKAETVKYNLRPHQQKAYDSTFEYLKTHERGKLIMACGTGKTFTSLRISEGIATDSRLVLFLVPSIALLSQTLKEWSAQAKEPLYPICICSDSGATKNKKDGAEFTELALPASTDVNVIHKRFVDYRKKQKDDNGLIVVFSTYQSIDVISNVQKEINAKENDSFIFDLIVCDEAHRTTGVTLKDKEESAFVKVHSNDNVKAKKRIYMTATPRLYSGESQKKAQENDAVLCSMDDPLIYGEEIYRIGFGEAVEKQLLTDYKVIVLTLDENSVDQNIQNLITEEDEEIKADDAIKLIGCINVLSKRTNYLTDKELFADVDPEPMRSAVAFCSNINNSKYLKNSFKVCQKAYYENLNEDEKSKIVVVDSDHVDGSMGSACRDEKLDWLKNADSGKNECRILNNVRCLSEGVDVPSLDAIIFLSSRNSQVDVVQSVGRVMRRAEGKKFGYIIIPVVIPANSNANEILEKSDDFKIVWSVLNALRAHDDRFNATVNKIELNKKKPNKISVTGTLPERIGTQVVAEDSSVEYVSQEFDFDDLQKTLLEKFEELQSAVYAKMVTKCGSRRYWADWGKDVGEIAKRNIERINKLIQIDGEHKVKFNQYLEGLRKNINPSISQDEAVEMLAQHIITKPVFEAIFCDDHFTNHNPVSKSLEEIVRLLDEKSNPEDMEKLERFYKSVQQRAEGIDNAESKQKIIVELYDSFFRNAFPLTVEKLGIVYTPIEVVDFIIHSAEYVLKTEFNRSLSDEKVNIIDPFTGTGTFITRLLQSGIIKSEDFERKYKHEIFANEIVLLAYYIASINIENVYHDLKAKLPNKNVQYNISHIMSHGFVPSNEGTKSNDFSLGNNKTDFSLEKSNPCDTSYESFSGICFTDTFQLYESDEQPSFDGVFEENTERVNEQKKMPITVVVGNPPYSVGQKSANDNAQNQFYEKLENKISDTYGKLSESNNTKSAHDSYIKAFRWATDRLDKTDGGIVAFVSNGAWLDGNAQDGFRKCIEQDFSSVYVFNLRGNQRTSGELSRKEGGKIFGSGSRTPISITILVKKSKKTQNEKAKIFYYDIGDYLSREEKLKIISDFKDVSKLPFTQLNPNEHGDWINLRNDKFGTWIPTEPQKKFDDKSQSFFTINSLGVNTNRDVWSYNFSLKELESNMSKSISFYNQQVNDLRELRKKDSKITADSFKTIDLTKISWCSSLIPKLNSLVNCDFQKEKIEVSCYRPFVKTNLYFGDLFIHRRGQFDNLFPTKNHQNLLICVSGVGVAKDFSCIITDIISDLELIGKSQCFPLYYYEEVEQKKEAQLDLFSDADSSTTDDEKYVRKDGISDFILKQAQTKFGNKVTKEDIFYYVYGLLHSKSYRETFSADLKKMLPRLPLVSDYQKFFAFVDAGRKLAKLHLEYETISPLQEVTVEGTEKNNFVVQKMKFNKNGKETDKSTIFFNDDITLKNIPSKVYDYIVNGKSAVEWIMERYAITTDKNSGIKNDPNDWSTEHQKPRYILDLILSVMNVSVQTVDIVDRLPEVDWEKE